MGNQLIAQTILQQLGGTGRLSTMTGANNFVSTDSGVAFKMVGKHPTNGGVSHIRISLTSMDLYDVEYLRIRAGKITEVAKSEGLYVDRLKNDIEQNTQKYLSL